MVLIVRCLICRKEFIYSSRDASELVLHIKIEHPLIDVKKSFVFKKPSEDIHKTLTKEALEIYIKNSKVLNKLVDQEAQTLDVDNELIMDERMIDPVASKRIKESIERSHGSSKISHRPDRESVKSYNSPRDNSVSKELAKRISKEVSPVESFRTPAESIESPTESLFESKRISTELKTPLESPTRNFTPAELTTRKSTEVRPLVESPTRKSTPAKLNPRETTLQANGKHHIPSHRESTPLTFGRHQRYSTDNSAVLETPTEIGDSSTMKRNKLYRTSLQKWRPGGSKIMCPNCGENRQPIIRAHTERVSNSAFGASLIATCWPFCLAPCLFTEPFLEFIHCSVCDYYLGKYDHKQSVLVPNTNQ